MPDPLRVVTRGAWEDLARDTPDLFDRAVEIEAGLNRFRDSEGKYRVYLSRYGRPLAEAIAQNQATLPLLDDDGGECDSGWCMT